MCEKKSIFQTKSTLKDKVNRGGGGKGIIQSEKINDLYVNNSAIFLCIYLLTLYELKYIINIMTYPLKAKVIFETRCSNFIRQGQY